MEVTSPNVAKSRNRQIIFNICELKCDRRFSDMAAETPITLSVPPSNLPAIDLAVWRYKEKRGEFIYVKHTPSVNQ